MEDKIEIDAKTRLLRCPFCNSNKMDFEEAWEYGPDGDAEKMFRIYCDCGAMKEETICGYGVSGRQKAADRLVEAWNERFKKH